METDTPEQAVIQAVTPEMFNAYAEWESPDLPDFPVKHAAFLGWVRTAFMAGFRSARLAQPLTEPQRVGQEGEVRCPNCRVKFQRIDDVDQHVAALSTPAQAEPVAWMYPAAGKLPMITTFRVNKKDYGVEDREEVPLYAHPQHLHKPNTAASTPMVRGLAGSPYPFLGPKSGRKADGTRHPSAG